MNLDFYRKSWWLARSQWRSPHALRGLQERRMRALLTHAYDHTPYYRRAFDACGVRPSAIRTLEDLRDIPLLHRKTILDQHDDLRASNADQFHPKEGRTSGTTGGHLAFQRDRATVNIGNAALWRFRGWHGFRYRNRLAEIRGIYGAGGPEFKRLAEFNGSANTLRLNAHMILNARWAAQVAEELVTFRPRAIISTPGILSYLSMYLLEHREYDIRPRAVFMGGERVFPEQRTLIAEAFRSRVVETYGNLEYTLFGGECEQGRLHFASEMGILEILHDGAPPSSGDSGEMVITSLWNRAFPFIRYAIGDVARVEQTVCPCGRGLPTGRILGGKQRDLLATSRGYVFLPALLTAHSKWRRKIEGARYYQERRDEVLVQVVKGPAFTSSDLDVLRSDLERMLDGLLRVSIEFVDNIELTSNGKYRVVVSQVPLEV